MGMDFHFLPSFFYSMYMPDMNMYDMQPWLLWLMFALATPVQFYVGWQYYVGAFKALRSGSSNMDVLIAMGSSVAYVYSLAIIFGLVSGHVYFETSAMIITLIRIGNFWKRARKVERQTRSRS